MPADAFPRVHFDAAQRAHCDDLCDDLIQRALEHHDAFHSAKTLQRWKLVRQRDALCAYKDRVQQTAAAFASSSRAGYSGYHGSASPSSSSSSSSSPLSVSSSARSSFMLCSGLVPGALDDVLAGLSSHDSESMCTVKAILSDKAASDGVLVLLLEANALESPVIFAGIKWFVLKVPGGHLNLTHDRDMLTYERIGRIVDRRGNYFAYHVIQSIELPEWGAPGSWAARRARSSHGFVRAHTSLCYLFRRVNADWVGCFMLGDFDPRGHIPQPITDVLVADTFLNIAKAAELAQAKAFSKLMAEYASRAPSTSRHCDRCMAAPKLKLLGAHKHCAGCRRTVCSKCRHKRTVFALNQRTRRPQHARFCRECIYQVVYHGGVRDDEYDDVDETYDDGMEDIPVLSAQTDDDDADQYKPQRARPPRHPNVHSSRPSSSISSVSSSPEPHLTLSQPMKSDSVHYWSSSNPSELDENDDTTTTTNVIAADDDDDDEAAAHVAAFVQACKDENAAFEWNSEELRRLTARLNSRSVKRTKEGRTHRKLAPPPELVRGTTAPVVVPSTRTPSSTSAASDASNRATRPRPRSTTDAIFQQHRTFHAASRTELTPSSRPSRAPSGTPAFEAAEASDPEAAYESFRAAVSRAQAGNPPKLNASFVFGGAESSKQLFHPLHEPEAEAAATTVDARNKYFSIDELD